MKIALCLFGHVGGKKGNDGLIDGDVDLSRTYKSYNKMIISNNDADIFIHSWSHDYKEELISLYKPNKSIIEYQKDFSFLKMEDYSMNYSHIYKLYFKKYKENTAKVLKDTMIRSSSRWYSNSKSLQLMSDYSRENQISYDYVFQGRLDLLFFKKFNFLELDSKYFYSPIREQEKGKALNEYFLISNQKNAEVFSEIYKNKNSYSIRPTIASKQHLDKNNIETKECPFTKKKDFNILRQQEIQDSNYTFSKRLIRVIKNPRIVISKVLAKFKNQ